jgi:membrane-associated phospholipid phosphatase
MASTAQGQGGGEAAIALPRGRPLPQVRARPRWWLDALVIAWLCWVYDMITNLAPLRRHAALSHGEGLLQLERTLHVDPELALNRWLIAHHTLATLLSYYYDNAHFIVTLGLLGWLWWRRADIYRPLRNMLVSINLIGLAVFWLYPVAPPRMLPGFTDVVAASHTFGSWHTGSLATAANQFAAMPSLHMAWAAWCALVLWRLSTRTWVRVVAVLYPCLTCLAVLATGNHYLLDVLAGLLAAVLAVPLARGLSVAGSACHKVVTKS